MKMLRDYFKDMKEFFLSVIIFALLFGGYFHMIALGQEQEEPKPPAKAEEKEPQIKTWKLPAYMQENLQRELGDFNKRFDAKVDGYKRELKTRFVEFKDMPNDVVLYLEGGFFITRSDLQKLQEQLRDKLTKEVKGDDKTTN